MSYANFKSWYSNTRQLDKMVLLSLIKRVMLNNTLQTQEKTEIIVQIVAITYQGRPGPILEPP